MARFAKLWPSLMLLTIVLLSACGASNNAAAQWTSVSERTSCEALNPSSCSGLYGFTIDNAANFAAGPSPAGVIIRGTITADELNLLSASANAFLSSITSTAPCPLGPITPGVGDGISISPLSGQSFVVLASNASPPGNCVSSDPAKANGLATVVQQLRLKYYPVPFPSS